MTEKLKMWELRKQELEGLITELGIELVITDKRFFNSAAAADPIIAGFQQVDKIFRGLKAQIQELKERPVDASTTEPATEHTVIEKPVWLTENEQAIVGLLKEKPLRFKEICDQSGMGKGNTFFYLRELQQKGVVAKTRFSHRNVVYYLVEGGN